MARFLKSSLITSVSGSIAGHTFSETRHGLILGKKPLQRASQFAVSPQQQNIISRSARLWREIPQGQRDRFQLFIDRGTAAPVIGEVLPVIRNPLTGRPYTSAYNLYMAYMNLELRTTDYDVYYAPASPEEEWQDTPTISGTRFPYRMYLHPSPVLASNGPRCVVFASKPFWPSKSYLGNDLIRIPQLIRLDQAAYDFHQFYADSVFTAPKVGQAVNFRLVVWYPRSVFWMPSVYTSVLFSS